MKRRFHCPIEAKKEYVAEVLTYGYRIDVAAKRFGMAPDTLGKWVRQYRDEVDEVMAKKRQEDELLKYRAENYEQLQEKYDKALKMLGEKELENQMLHELLKKKYPDWK